MANSADSNDICIIELRLPWLLFFVNLVNKSFPYGVCDANCTEL